MVKEINNYCNNNQKFPATHYTSIFYFYSLYYSENDKIVKEVKTKLNLLLCWLGIHRYKVIDVSFGFAAGDSVRTIQCKVCGIKEIKKG